MDLTEGSFRHVLHHVLHPRVDLHRLRVRELPLRAWSCRWSPSSFSRKGSGDSSSCTAECSSFNSLSPNFSSSISSMRGSYFSEMQLSSSSSALSRASFLCSKASPSSLKYFSTAFLSLCRVLRHQACCCCSVSEHENTLERDLSVSSSRSLPEAPLAFLQTLWRSSMGCPRCWPMVRHRPLTSCRSRRQ